MTKPPKPPETLYRRVQVTDWHARLSPFAKLIRAWLKTGPQTTQLQGVVLIGRAALAEELELDDEVARAALTELEDGGYIVADWKARLVWLPDRLAEVPPANENGVKAWRWVWSTVPTCALRDRIERQLVEHLATLAPSLLAAAATFLRVDERAAEAAAVVGIRESNRSANGSPNPSDDGSGNGSADHSANGSPNEIRDLRSEIPLPPSPPPPPAEATVPATVGPDDDGDRAWVAGWNRGAKGSVGVHPVAAPSAQLLTALGEARTRWGRDDATSGWATPRGAEGAARALVAEAHSWRAGPPTLERLLLRMSARFDELMRAGEAHQPRRTLVAAAPAAPMRLVDEPELDPAEELEGLDELARRSPGRLTPALAARREQLRLELVEEAVVEGALRAPDRLAAHRSTAGGALRVRPGPAAKYSRRSPLIHIHPGLLTLPFTDALN